MLEHHCAVRKRNVNRRFLKLAVEVVRGIEKRVGNREKKAIIMNK